MRYEPVVDCRPLMSLTDQLVRWRVSLSWLAGVGALAVARPTPSSFAAGVAVGMLGQALRLWAAGHLERASGLTTSGPYAWTRNPLYLGSMIMGAGFVVASSRWELILVLGLLVFGVFVPVIRQETAHLSAKFPESYARFAEAVPLLVPRFPRDPRPGEPRRFAWTRARVNGEHLTMMGWVGAVSVLAWKLF